MKHYIIVKFNRKISEEEFNDIKSIFNKTLEIEGVNFIDYFRSCSERENRFDLMIKMDMTKEGLPLYDASDPHKEWKEKYKNLIESKAIFDCEE